MTPDDVIDGRVGFGTKVVFSDTKTGEEKSYTFLGRWESDPDNGTIDINAPLGQCLINHIPGDEVEFSNGAVSTTYRIISVEKIDF